MQPIQVILEDAPEHIHIPNALQHHKVEVTFKLLDQIENKSPVHSAKYIESICGVLDSHQDVSLEQMEKAIKQRGGEIGIRD